MKPGAAPTKYMHILHLLPNLISISALCAGLTAIRMAVDGRFGVAVGLVCLAAALDGVDGRLARMLKSESAIGAELDSLCDVVNFGVAPGLVLYYWGMKVEGSFGWMAVLIFAVCSLLRLARFNVGNKQSASETTPKGFVGVPSPAGAMLAFGPIFFALAFRVDTPPPALVIVFFMLSSGALMISRIPTPSFKTLRIPSHTARFFLLGSACLIAALLTFPWITLFFLDVAYFSAVLITWWRSSRSLSDVI